MAFTALAIKAYKDPLTTVWAGSIKSNFDHVSFTQGIKAWVNFEVTGANLTAMNVFNFSTLTRNGTGDFSIALTTAVQSTSPAFIGMSQNGQTFIITGLSAGGVRIQTTISDGSVSENDNICIAVIGSGA